MTTPHAHPLTPAQGRARLIFWILMGFAAYTPSEIEEAVGKLAHALRTVSC